MHNRRIAKAKEENAKLRKAPRWRKKMDKNREIKRQEKIRERAEAKLRNPKFDKDRNVFIYVPYTPPPSRKQLTTSKMKII